MINFSNYAPQSVSDKGKTHEETFGFTRASLRSVAEYTFTGNYNRCCNFPNSDFVRTSLNNNIMWRCPNFNFHSKEVFN